MPHIEENLPIEQYHAHQSISHSGLNEAFRSIAHYREYAKNGSGIDKDAALDGNLIHCAILEPEELLNRYVVIEKCDKRTKIGKETWTSAVDSNPGKTIITPSQFDMAIGAAKAAGQHPLSPKKGREELSIFWDDTDTLLPLRCRPDWVEDNGTVIDVKTIIDARSFASSVQKYGYYRQEALYRTGLAAAGIECSRFLFLVVEKKAPYGVMFYELDSEYVLTGYQECRATLASIALATRNGDSPGYSKEIKSLALPRWMRAYDDEEF